MLHRALTSKPCMNPNRLHADLTWMSLHPFFWMRNMERPAQASRTGIISLDSTSAVPSPQWINLQSLSLPPTPFPKGRLRSGVVNTQALRGSAGLELVSSKRSDFAAMPFLWAPQEHKSTQWLEQSTEPTLAVPVWTVWCLALLEAKAQSSAVLW